jgi:hypothetical protein
MITPKRPDRFSKLCDGLISFLSPSAYLERDRSKPVRSVFELKQKRRGAGRHDVRERKKKLLIFGQQARFEEPLVIKSAYTDAQENVVQKFVSHSAGIITQRLSLLKVTTFW